MGRGRGGGVRPGWTAPSLRPYAHGSGRSSDVRLAPYSNHPSPLSRCCASLVQPRGSGQPIPSEPYNRPHPSSPEVVCRRATAVDAKGAAEVQGDALVGGALKTRPVACSIAQNWCVWRAACAHAACRPNCTARALAWRPSLPCTPNRCRCMCWLHFSGRPAPHGTRKARSSAVKACFVGGRCGRAAVTWLGQRAVVQTHAFLGHDDGLAAAGACIQLERLVPRVALGVVIHHTHLAHFCGQAKGQTGGWVGGAYRWRAGLLWKALGNQLRLQ